MSVLRFQSLIAVLTVAVCTLIVIAPVRMANEIMRRRVAEEGDPAFTLFYRVVAFVGGVAALYVLIGDLWNIAHA